MSTGTLIKEVERLQKQADAGEVLAKAVQDFSDSDLAHDVGFDDTLKGFLSTYRSAVESTKE